MSRSGGGHSVVDGTHVVSAPALTKGYLLSADRSAYVSKYAG
jgi:hypothetical protein